MAMTIDGSSGVTFPNGTVQLSAGNQIALTASGSLTLGKAVLQQSDNTVVQMTGSNPAQGTPSFAGGLALTDTVSGAAYLAPISAVNTAGTTIVTLVQLANSQTLQIRAGTISGTTITWGTAVNLNTTTNFEYVACALNFDPNSGNWVVWYNNGAANTMGARTVTVTGTTITLGTAVNLSVYVDASGSPAIDATYDANTGKHVVFYTAITTRFPTISVLTVSGTTVSYGTALVVESVTAVAIHGPNRIVYDTLSLKNFIAWASGNNGGTIKIAMITVSGTTATTGTVLDTTIPYYVTTLGPPDDYDWGNRTCQLWVDTARSRYVIVNTSPTTFNGSTYAFASKEYTLSGTTLSYSADVGYVTTSGAGSFGSALYDSNTNTLALTANDGVYYFKYSNTLTNTYQEFASSTRLSTFTGNYASPIVWGEVIKLNSTTYASTVVGKRQSTSGTPVVGYQNYVTIVTPATSNRQLGAIYGVSNGNYTDGQTASIVYKNSGNYVSGLSGLTINRPYYFDISNTLSLSNVNETPYGLTLRSLSTTQLQVL